MAYCDYVFIKDGQFTVPQQFTFTLPSADVTQRALLSFRVKSIAGEQDLEFWVQINDRPVPVHTQKLYAPRTYDSTIVEVIENHVLRVGAENVIYFNKEMIAGGAIYLSDVVLWFKADTLLSLSSRDHVQRIRLDANQGDLRMGGNGADGDLVLFPSSGNIGSLSTATIRLDATGGKVLATSFTAGGTTLNVPDYVWDSNYALMPLAELRAYIARERRLPNVPSAAQIKREGLDLSQFQMQLLEKIEELTRYLLAQQETIEQQETRIDALEGQLSGSHKAISG